MPSPSPTPSNSSDSGPTGVPGASAARRVAVAVAGPYSSPPAPSGPANSPVYWAVNASPAASTSTAPRTVNVPKKPSSSSPIGEAMVSVAVCPPVAS